jgi:hypothetical protein
MAPLIPILVFALLVVPLMVMAYLRHMRLSRKRPAFIRASLEVRAILLNTRQLLRSAALRGNAAVAARLRFAIEALTMALVRRDVSEHPDLRTWLDARTSLIEVLARIQHDQDEFTLAHVARGARSRIERALERTGRWTREEDAPRDPV